MHSIFNDFLTHKGLLTDDQKEQIRPYYTYKNYAKGETILYKGTVCEHSFFVEKGLLRFYSIDKQGKEHIVQFAQKDGSLVIEVACILMKHLNTTLTP